MKNEYKLICVGKNIYGHRYVNYRDTFTNKVKALAEYEYQSRRGYVHWIMLKNMTTGEVLKAQKTGNTSVGPRTEKIILK